MKKKLVLINRPATERLKLEYALARGIVNHGDVIGTIFNQQSKIRYIKEAVNYNTIIPIDFEMLDTGKHSVKDIFDSINIKNISAFNDLSEIHILGSSILPMFKTKSINDVILSLNIGVIKEKVKTVLIYLKLGYLLNKPVNFYIIDAAEYIFTDSDLIKQYDIKVVNNYHFYTNDEKKLTYNNFAQKSLSLLKQRPFEKTLSLAFAGTALVDKTERFKNIDFDNISRHLSNDIGINDFLLLLLNKTNVKEKYIPTTEYYKLLGKSYFTLCFSTYEKMNFQCLGFSKH